LVKPPKEVRSESSSIRSARSRANDGSAATLPRGAASTRLAIHRSWPVKSCDGGTSDGGGRPPTYTATPAATAASATAAATQRRCSGGRGGAATGASRSIVTPEVWQSPYVQLATRQLQ